MIRVLFLWLADFACIYGMWFISVWGYNLIGVGSYQPSFYLKVWPIGLVFVALNVLFRLYHGRCFYPAAPYAPVEEMRRLVGSAVIAHLLMIAYLVISYQTTVNYSRAVIVLSGVLTAVFAQPVRDVMRALMKLLGIGQIPVHIIGDTKIAKQLRDEFRHNAYWGFCPVKSNEKATIAFVCRKELPTRGEYMQYGKRYTHVELVPSEMELPVVGSRLVSFSGVGVMELANLHRMPALKIEKWLLDRMLSVVVFVVCSPLFVIVPILIKLTSRGPVYYRQERIGKDGKVIRVWKFRSMYSDADRRLAALLDSDRDAAAEWKAKFKLTHDPRITPLGHILRRTSIDELPQLFNVFAGEMSLVGPRPIVKDEVAYYGDAYEIFSSVLPGLTGLWQASGRSDTNYARRVALDVHYVLNWSPWMDLWIVFRTITAVVKMDGSR